MADEVDSILRRLQSTKLENEISQSRMDVGESMKAAGTPSNSILLAAIHAEMKRNADETSVVSSRLNIMSQALSEMSSTMLDIKDILEKQTSLIASTAVLQSSSGSEQPSRRIATSSRDWYYNGTKLGSRYHIYACILSHFMEMVQAHMDRMDTYYPDSHDCDFKTLVNAVRLVCNARCSIRNVEYKDTIATAERQSQPFELILPVIASTDPKLPVSTSETQVGKMYNSITRPIMIDIDRIRQRLLQLVGILSVKQIDILRSISYPQLKQDSDSELNWDSSCISSRSSHPLVREISSLTAQQKNRYIEYRMQGKSTDNSYSLAKPSKE